MFQNTQQQYTPNSGTVYLIHLDQPLSPNHTSQHYIGWAANLAARWQQHLLGNAARFTQVAKQRGIKYHILRAWHGDKKFERKLKNRKEGPHMCPICGHAKGIYTNELTPQEITNALLPF